MLRIARGLSLPDDTITKTLAILAKRRVGKTYAGSVIAEEMVMRGLPFYVLDPTGAWWGLRAAANGKDAGYPVIVIGGEHGDVPIDHTAGAAVADLIVDHPGFYVIDVSEIDEIKANTVRFATAFLTRLKSRKTKNRDPLHGFWDEADIFAPQRPGHDETKMLGAAEAIVRRGGLHGLGTTLITQRPAVLNKNVLSQIDIAIFLRTIDTRDRRAVKEYLDVVADDDGRKAEILGALASFKIGEAQVFGPGEEPQLYERIQIRERRTFNSSATPKPGQKRIEPARLAEVDISDLRDKMAESIERAAADDPKVLRKRIRDLEKQIADRPKVAPERIEVEVPVPFVPPEVLKGVADLGAHIEKINGTITGMSDALTQRAEALPDSPARPRPVPRASARPAPPRPAPRAQREPVDGEIVVSGSQQRILDALAMLANIGVPVAPKVQVALFAKQSLKSSGFTNNLGALRSAGLIDYPQPGMVALTEAGAARADGGQAPSTVAELWAFVEQLVGSSKWRILRALTDVYPESLSKAELAELAEASVTSSGYTNNLGALRSLKLLDYPEPGRVAAEPILFLDEA